MTPEELAGKVQEAVNALHSAVERQDAEIKKYGAPLQETKNEISRIDAALTEFKGKLDIIAQMDERMKAMELKMERREVTPPGSNKDGMSDEEKKFRKSVFYKWVRGGRESLDPNERKALVEDTTGQYVIEPELDQEIERILPTITIVRGLATVRTINKDRLKMKSMGGVSVGWGKLETGSGITETDMTPGAPTYQYVEDLYALAKIGEDELDDSDINLESMLAEEFARACGEEEEAQYMIGTGHDYNKPEGMTLNSTLVTDTKTTAAAGAVTVDAFLDMVYGCPIQFRRNGVFIVNSTVELAIRKLRAGGSTTTDGAYLWQPSVQAGKPNTFLGFPIYNQDDMEDLSSTAKCIAVFGDIRQGYRIVDRQGMTLQRLTELYSEEGLVGFKIRKRTTGGVMKASQKPIVLLTEHA